MDVLVKERKRGGIDSGNRHRPRSGSQPAAEKGFSVALGRCIFLPDDSGKASVAYKRLQAVGTAGTAGSPPGAAFVGGCGPGGV